MTTVDTRPLVRGLMLRSLVVLVLLDRRRPMDLAELTRAIAQSGFAVGGRPGKEIADALRWEVRRGRVVRHARGVYGPGVVAKVTKHRMRARVAQMRNRTDIPPRLQLRPTAAGSRG